MDIRVSGRQFEVTDALRDYAISKISKTQKLVSGNASATITLSVQKLTHTADIIINTNGHLIQAEEAREEMYEAIDKAVLKLERQLKKHKGKIKNHRTSQSLTAYEMSEPIGAPVEPKKTPQANATIKKHNIRKIKSVTLSQMTTEAAVDEMESLSQDFFLFLDKSTKIVKLLYKNKNNEIDLIEPLY